MRVTTLCVLALTLIGIAIATLPPPERSYKILMLLPVTSKSHRNVFLALVQALVDRGHEIVMVSPLPPSFKHPNVTEIDHGIKYLEEKSKNMFENMGEAGGFQIFEEVLPATAREFYKVPAIAKLYAERKQFDLIIFDHMFNELAYPFAYQLPFITIATPGMDPRQSAVLGNVPNPSYVYNLFTSYSFPMSMWERILNTFMHIWIPFYWRNWAIVPLVEEEISAQFPNLPPLLDIERNQSLTLINTHFSINKPMPLLPSQVEVGAMHCRPSKSLPEDIDSWISGAGSAGVIYFSLGSVTRGETMPLEYRKVFLEAFSRLPQRVLWKFEGELEGVSDNVKISSWLPQQDILAHPNVKVFISHGGLLSLQESIYHATPLLILPIFSDQPRNAKFVQNSALGQMLLWKDLNADILVEVLTDIIVNSKYKENISRMSSSLKDQLTTPQERAVFWTEYVIRHQGAPQLRCPATQLSWMEFLMLDVLVLMLLGLVVVLFVLQRFLKRVCTLIFGNHGKKKTD